MPWFQVGDVPVYFPDDDGGGGGDLPPWAIWLLVIAVFLIACFSVGFIVKEWVYVR